jgi:hypothetical protein
MPPVITSEVVVAYAQCPRKAYLLLFSPDKGEPQEYVELLKQQRCIHQVHYRTLRRSGDISFNLLNISS